MNLRLSAVNCSNKPLSNSLTGSNPITYRGNGKTFKYQVVLQYQIYQSVVILPLFHSICEIPIALLIVTVNSNYSENGINKIQLAKKKFY